MIEKKLKSIFDKKFEEIADSNKYQEYLNNLCLIDERIKRKGELLALVIPCEQDFIRVKTIFGCIEMPVDFCLKVVSLGHLP